MVVGMVVVGDGVVVGMVVVVDGVVVVVGGAQIFISLF